MQIRKAMHADLEALSRLCERTFGETYDDLTADEVRSYAREFFSVPVLQEHLDSNTDQVFVVEQDRLLGYTLLCESSPPLPLATEPGIECVRLYLERAAHGRTLGRHLLDTAIRWAGENGYRTLWLKVWDQNTRAIAFYEKNGFTRMGIVPYTEAGMDDRVIVMERALGVS